MNNELIRSRYGVKDRSDRWIILDDTLVDLQEHVVGDHIKLEGDSWGRRNGFRFQKSIKFVIFNPKNPIVKAASAFILEVEEEEERRRKTGQDYQLNRENFE